MNRAISELKMAMPPDAVLIDRGAVRGYTRDRAMLGDYGEPLAVVMPRSKDEVRKTVEVCASYAIPLVPRGAGTGMSGGANAVDGCVVVSMKAMNKILEINARERYTRVQPGVINGELRKACKEYGLWYPPDPASASESTIGGNVATNAGGLCCVKYGVTADYVLEIEAVIKDGVVVRLGRQTMKGVAGYDLARLMTGSEGTLGLITEVTLRLRGLSSAEVQTVVGYFDSVDSAGAAASLVANEGVTPSSLELIDRYCLEAVERWKHLGLPRECGALLFGRTDERGASGIAEASVMKECFSIAGATKVECSRNQEESERLFEARRLVFTAVERMGAVVSEDVCVAREKIPEMLNRVNAISREYEVTIANIAHAGDGNLHPLIVVPEGDSTAKVRAGMAFDAIMKEALELGGTITGEHGIGILKKSALREELGEDVIELHQRIKEVFDPHNIFNPGKVFAGP